MAAAPVASPCNAVCTINPAYRACIGCGRTLAEIAEWGRATPDRQRAILALLPERLLRRQG